MNYQSAIRGEALTLPSIEGGFGTLNISKDPPKSYFTRYKPKVGDTNELTKMIDESGDRACEVIMKYARGNNPMVSVSYSNSGTSGGQYRFGSGSTDSNPLTNTGTAQAFLPYRVAREGAFRPPIVPPEQLLPLSRQPRPNTFQYTNKGSGASKKEDINQCRNVDLKALRDELLHSYVESRASVRIDMPLVKPSDVDNMIRERRNLIIDTNKGEVRALTLDDFKGNQSVRIQDRFKGNARTNTVGLEQNTVLSKVKDMERNIPNGTMVTNTIGLEHNLPIITVKELDRNIPTGSMSTNNIGFEKDSMEYKVKEYSRNIPMGQIISNKIERGVDLNPFVCKREYTNLPARASRGGIDNGGFQPNNQRQDDSAVRLGQGNSIAQKAYLLQRGH